MLSDSFVGSLPLISYRITNEPNFLQKLKSQIEKRILDSGQKISEEEAAALVAYLDSNAPFSQAVTSFSEDPIELDLWIG